MVVSVLLVIFVVLVQFILHHVEIVLYDYLLELPHKVTVVLALPDQFVLMEIPFQNFVTQVNIAL
jgi:hypothetical protein